MIHVLCSNCNTHLADTDVQRLDWPLTGEMFSVVFDGWYLRPGMLNLDIFCPACNMFPFFHDPYTAGGNAVGKTLNILGVDGKPVVMSVKQILMTVPRKPGVREVSPAPISAPTDTDILAGEKPTFPCPSCGAKRNFHKKGCPTQAHPALAAPPAEETPKHLREFEKHRQYREANPDPAGRLASIDARARSGPDGENTPVTAAEVAEVERERESKLPSRNTEGLRKLSPGL